MPTRGRDLQHPRRSCAIAEILVNELIIANRVDKCLGEPRWTHAPKRASPLALASRSTASVTIPAFLKITTVYVISDCGQLIAKVSTGRQRRLNFSRYINLVIGHLIKGFAFANDIMYTAFHCNLIRAYV
jgi:hypothetical protein